MSTEIKIKRGSGVTPLLADGELGYNKDAKTLSIGTGGGNVTVGRPIQTVTQETYDAMSKDDDTIYIIESDDALVTQSAMEAYAAPNGFGLGGGAHWLDSSNDLNNITDNGWYTFVGCSNSPVSTGTMLVVNRHEDGNYAHQIAFQDSGDGSDVYIRRRASGNWQAWRKWAPEDFASASHTHTAAQVGARPSSWTPSASDVGAVPTSRTVNGKALSSNITLSASDVSAAPAGYGLGTTPNVISDANAALNSGWYRFTTSTSNKPFSGDGWMRVTAYSTAFLIQEAFTEVDYRKVARWCNNGTWTPWEYIDPPMHVSTEYTTSEKFFGKTVYKYVLNVGYLSAGTHSFEHGIPGIDECIHCEMINEGYGNFTAHCDMEFSTTSIYLNMPWAAGAVRCILSYTKN